MNKIMDMEMFYLLVLKDQLEKMNLSINTCDGWENCYFKQLQRLQKENEEIKANKEKYYLLTLDYEAKIRDLVQALENIKQFLIYADHSNTSNKYFENVENALIIANEVLNDRN